jgi:hypothetical protein
MRKIFLAAAASVTLASPAAAAVVYSNNFNAENGGNSALNYNGFNGLTVTGGTVDLVKSGDFGITCSGGAGACVDLDGSTANSGLTSSASFAFNARDRVALSFTFSGNQRQPPSDTFYVRFDYAGNVSGTHGFESSAPVNASIGASGPLQTGVNIVGIEPSFAMTRFTYFIVTDVAGSMTFSFEDQGNDNIGIIIDNVSLSIGVVPEPSAWALMIIGFGAVGAAARRSRVAGKPAAA